MTSYTATEIGTFLTIIFAGIAFLMRTWHKIDENTRATHATATAVQAIDVKTAVIEGHVNSKEATYVAEIAGLRRENELLRKMNDDAKSTAALLAQATATTLERTRTLELPG